MTRKQTVGENLLYVMVWAAIILVPVLNSQMMSELHISFENVLIAWRQIAPYFIIFIIHNSVLAPAAHAAPQVQDLPALRPGAHHSRILAGRRLRRAPHRPFPPPRRPRGVRRLPESLVLEPGDVLERRAGILYDGGQHGYQAHLPVDARRAADGRTQTPEPGSRNGLSEIPDKSPFLHEHAQQHPRPDRHRHRICQKCRDRAVEDDALCAL